MRSVVLIIVAAQIALLTGLFAGDTPDSGDEFTKVKSDTPTSWPLRAPRKARSWPSPEFFVRNPGSRSIRRRRVANTASTAAKARWFTLPRMPENTAEDVVYEFDASGLIAAGLDPSRLQQLPERGQMTPGVWYFLPKGQQDPHHARAMSAPTIAIAINVK